MTQPDLDAIIDAGNIPEYMTPGAVYCVVCTLAARVKELEAKLERVRGYAVELGATAEKLQTPWQREDYPAQLCREDRARQLGRVVNDLRKILDDQ